MNSIICVYMNAYMLNCAPISLENRIEMYVCVYLSFSCY